MNLFFPLDILVFLYSLRTSPRLCVKSVLTPLKEIRNGFGITRRFIGCRSLSAVVCLPYTGQIKFWIIISLQQVLQNVYYIGVIIPELQKQFLMQNRYGPLRIEHLF